MKSKKWWTNERIFIQMFWEHASIPGPLSMFLNWANDPSILEHKFQGYERLASESLELMQSEWERRAVVNLARRRFGGRLTPSAQLLLGLSGERVPDEDLVRLHGLLDEWYGSETGRLIRLGKDLKKYGVQSCLMTELRTWVEGKSGPGLSPSWVCTERGSP